MCRDVAADSEEWVAACIGYARVAQNLGNTVIAKAIGWSLEGALRKGGAEVDPSERQENPYEQPLGPTDRRGQIIYEYHLFGNSKIFYSYLNNMRTVGEIEAVRISREEIARSILEDPSQLCGPAGGVN